MSDDIKSILEQRVGVYQTQIVLHEYMKGGYLGKMTLLEYLDLREKRAEVAEEQEALGLSTNRTEYDFQKDVIKFLNQNKIWHMRTQMGTQSGQPDLILCLNGFFVGLELKREDGTGKPTEQQLKIKKDIQQSGGFSFIVSTMDEVKQALKTVRDLIIVDTGEPVGTI